MEGAQRAVGGGEEVRRAVEGLLSWKGFVAL